MKTTLCALLFCLASGTLWAGQYYVDGENGNDASGGQTPETAWRSLEKVNNADLAAGDTILFRRGCVWRGRLMCHSGTEGNPITYGAYGEGRAPTILGSADLADPNLWEAPTDPESRVWTSRTTFSQEQNVGNIVLTLKGELPCSESLFTDDSHRFAGWIRWKAEDLKQQNDFSFDYDTGKVQFYSEKNPGELFSEIEAAKNGGIVIAANFVTIENLAIGFGGGHGVSGSPEQGTTVRNCDLFWIGGSELRGYPTPCTRYGNGVEFWDRGKNHLVEGCRFRQIYDVAMTIQGPSASIYRNIVWRNNKVDRCEQSLEIWLTNPESEIIGMVFEGNQCTNAGFGWAHDQRPNKNGTHLLGYNMKAKTIDVSIRNNLFSYARNGLIMFWNGRLAEFDIDHNTWIQPEANGVPGLEQPLFIWGLSEQEKHHETFEKYRELTGNDQNSEFK